MSADVDLNVGLQPTIRASQRSFKAKDTSACCTVLFVLVGGGGRTVRSRTFAGGSWSADRRPATRSRGKGVGGGAGENDETAISGGVDDVDEYRHITGS